MSTIQATIVKVSNVINHPNADRLDIITVLGWQCVIRKDTIRPDDLVVYIPIDSVLPDELITKLFGPDSKIKPTGNRIRTIKIRGAISQGLAVPISDLGFTEARENDDVTQKLGITKWEPPIRKSSGSNMAPAPRKLINENFRKYTDIEHLKKFPKALDGEEVIIYEKIHGTNFRAGWCPRPARTWWQILLKRIGFWNNKWEFCWGSHNVQLQRGRNSKTDVYTEAVAKYDLKNLLPQGTVVYGEIYGDGIQKNYSYGCKAGERKAIFFDIYKDGGYLSPPVCEKFLASSFLPMPPIIYIGIYNLEKIEELCKGRSILCPEQPVIEGGVIKPLAERIGYMGRMVFKFLNPEYLMLKDNTENH